VQRSKCTCEVQRVLYIATQRASLSWLGRWLLVLRLSFFRQSKRSQAFYLFANVASSRLVFGRRLSTIPRAPFLLKTLFCPLSGFIRSHAEYLPYKQCPNPTRQANTFTSSSVVCSKT